MAEKKPTIINRSKQAEAGHKPANDGKIRNRVIRHDDTVYTLPEGRTYNGVVKDCYAKDTEPNALFFSEIETDGMGTFVNYMAEDYLSINPFNSVLVYVENKLDREITYEDLVGIRIQFTTETVYNEKKGKEYCAYKTVEVIEDDTPAKSPKRKSTPNPIDSMLDDLDDLDDEESDE